MLNIRNANCRLCSLHEKAHNVCISGEGSGRLPILVLGEAPGREEDAQARPFVGASGKLLRNELRAAGLPLSKCYLTNTVKCFPDGTPSRSEINVCASTYLQKEVDMLLPKYILALGNTALSATCPGFKVGEVRGQLLDSWLSDGFVFPVWHPSYILRDNRKMRDWQDDLATFAALVKVDLGL